MYRIHGLVTVSFSLWLGCASAAPAAPDAPSARAATQGGDMRAAEPLGTVYSADTTTIEAAPGDRFSLALPSEPTLTWTLDPELDQSVARFVEARSEGSMHYLVFDATGIGPTDLRVRQRGPTSQAPGPPAAEVSVRVRVEPAP